MNSSMYQQKEVGIDIKELLWKLLSQWKAMLAAAMIMALLFPCAKYLKDRNSYSAAIEDKKKTAEEAKLPAEERIDKVLEGLSEEESEDVLYLVQQKDMVNEQLDYLENSIWLNTDPASQRKLAMTYYIKGRESVDIRSLANAYTLLIHKDGFVKDIGEIIKKDAKKEYVDELIETWTVDVVDSEAAGTNLTIAVTMLDDTDESKLKETVDDAVKSIEKSTTPTYGEHEIKLLNAEVGSVYNQAVIDRRTNTNYTINNLKSNINNVKNSMTPEQQAAFESIVIIKSEDSRTGSRKSEEDIEEVGEPGFSIKYACLGFLLGAFLYAGIYTVLLVLRGGIGSAISLQSYTSVRLLGDVYYKKPAEGIKRLLHSELADKHHYKGKTDCEERIAGISDSLEAISRHAGTRSVAFLDMRSADDAESDRLVSALSERTGNKGIKADIIDVSKEVNEDSLLSVDDAVIIADAGTKANALGSLMSLMKDYDIRPLGSIFISEM